MAEPEAGRTGEVDKAGGTDASPIDDDRDAEADSDVDPSSETFRRAVEEKYDFENFSPADMAEMTVDEWEAVFDPETWITGAELLARVEADLKHRVVKREVFAVIERFEQDGEERLLAYSDTGYAVVHPDGSVDGEGMIRQDVEPIVALCSMDDYDVPEPPDTEGELLPRPDDIPVESGELGNRVMQFIAGVQLIAGVGLLLSPLVVDLGGRGTVLLTTVVGLGFIFIGALLFFLVANARLSGRFRAREYRERLDAMGVGTDERPEFLPIGEDDEEREKSNA